ncbi:hypothetical protein BDW72DRAFT_211669 [Aspergillus terricola var. indicus]
MNDTLSSGFHLADRKGYLLRSGVTATCPEDSFIADIATGTAIWLLDLARELPPSDSNPVPVIQNADADAETPAFNQLRRFVYSQGRHDWVLDLPRLLEENGFTDARLEHFRDRREPTAANGDQHLATMQEFVVGLELKGLSEDAERLRALLGEVYEEAKAGVALSMPRVVTYSNSKR